MLCDLMSGLPSLSLIYLPGHWGFSTGEPSGRCISDRAVTHSGVHRPCAITSVGSSLDPGHILAYGPISLCSWRWPGSHPGPLLSSLGTRFSVAVVRAPACHHECACMGHEQIGRQQNLLPVTVVTELVRAASAANMKGVISDWVSLASQQLPWSLATWVPQSCSPGKPLSRLQ